MIQIPQTDIDNPPRSLGKLTEQEKQRGIVALNESLKRSNMGYTIENGKVVIWTEKKFICDEWPFQDEGENHTFFFTNLKSGKAFASCLSILNEYEKEQIVLAHLTDLRPGTFILKSKKSHHKQRAKNKQ